ncbi:hypothetical protein SELMODRAFT_118439 [Selaginella moellendorffii]|uniref:Protein kinase domain-containing protein n=1 Tax=Selaginella moellendorffii TaxID=88036 RepID=D8SJL7_SELML|nr:uncharacterized protein LOC9651148 [Selaginella moellendorffii]EFJ15382.1 hypothetical protein SELMODRAFT_118439 [Selaginella moellendorffii]|eukprot:XP_002983481.1 uncharacterized protein LOC9651148 [Selaginella moellendorffii]
MACEAPGSKAVFVDPRFSAGKEGISRRFRVESRPLRRNGRRGSHLRSSFSLAQRRTALNDRFSSVARRFEPALSKILRWIEGSRREDELSVRYDPDAISSYFQARPFRVIARVLAVASECSLFILSIVLDKTLDKSRENERRRAAEFLLLITKLGPTAIKIGQALSIRPDMVSTAYLEQLQKLQDKVSPFSNELATQMIEKNIGNDVFYDISSEPIAAGSLGQVYKARLKSNGDVVAVKVQRPGVLQVIACDLFILRLVAGTLQRMLKSHSDFVDLLDTWALRFFDELDYFKEANNAQRFIKSMSPVPMVVIPKVYMEYTSGQVLTTKWIDGEKLSEIREANALSLVNTALTCYLFQLLESGFLHADPHPGNLLRTEDGRLCILDYGLMTEVTEERQLAMIEYLAHVGNSDYVGVAEDLVKLGFLPDQTDPRMTTTIVPEVTRIFTELLRGGGARKVNMQEISNGIAKISKDYPLVVPSYFSLIIRAFSLLEGIGLEFDPDYTITKECYPYVAKRLVTDDSSRMRKVLKYFLYSENNQLNVTRLEYIFTSFQDFQKLMSLEQHSNDFPDDFAKQSVSLLLDPK